MSGFIKTLIFITILAFVYFAFAENNKDKTNDYSAIGQIERKVDDAVNKTKEDMIQTANQLQTSTSDAIISTEQSFVDAVK